ncbi:MAG: ATP-grasp domain-containing protein [Planctomycetales bacterium]|nr:ATP-grasp domain-containing protein [Planctomycetales bacterium]
MFQPSGCTKVSTSTIESTDPPPAWRPIVVGFAARALAVATASLGRRPIVVDHFADHDCQQCAEACFQLPQWGEARPFPSEVWKRLLRVAGAGSIPSPSLPRPPLLLGGGTENWPQLVDALHGPFHVLGPTSTQLSLLRCRHFWQDLAEQNHCRFPESRSDLRSTASGLAGWLSKPLRGAGGLGIRRLAPAASSPPTPPDGRERYWQREIQGRALGAHCILYNDRVQLLGITASFSADDWPGPSEFVYRGSWGPVPLCVEQQRVILGLCQAVRHASGLRGWLQIDFIEDSAGELWLLELNPRWAAGMEILLNSGVNAVAHHLAAWDWAQGRWPSVRTQTETTARTQGAENSARQFAKAIVYAQRDIELSKDRLRALHALPPAEFADLPSRDMLGQTVAAGHPLLTVRTALTTDGHGSQVRQNLLRALHLLRQQVASCTVR